MSTFYDNIKDVCLDKGITVAQLERDLGLERSIIYKWQKVEPGAKKLAIVAEYLGVPIERLHKDVPKFKRES